jgi:hypothetical protein
MLLTFRISQQIKGDLNNEFIYTNKASISISALHLASLLSDALQKKETEHL